MQIKAKRQVKHLLTVGEMEVQPSKVKPFDAFKNVFKMLGQAGFFKLIDEPESRFRHTWHWHERYRVIAFFIIIIYNIQHMIFIVQMYKIGNMDSVFEAMMVEFSHINLIFKFLAVNLGSSKLDKMNELIKSPDFEPQNKKDEKYIADNIETANKMWRVVMNIVTMASTFWMISPFLNRLQNENSLVGTSYIPFVANTWPKFFLAWIIEIYPLFWIGYAHICLDYLIGVYYLQAVTQLKIIKNNLEHLADQALDVEDATMFRYVDEIDGICQKRFIRIVRRYEKVVWFVEQLSSVYNISITYQFLSSSFASCLYIYKLSLMDKLTMDACFLVSLSCCLLLQILLYCYFGGLVQYESDSVSTAVYLSDWLSLSPRFRKQLLIAMSRFGILITPNVAFIVPLSLSTFISILKSAYSLLAVLNTTNNYT